MSEKSKLDGLMDLAADRIQELQADVQHLREAISEYEEMIKALHAENENLRAALRKASGEKY